MMIFCSSLDSLCLVTLVIVQSIATAGVLTRSNRGTSASQPIIISPEWLSTPMAITLLKKTAGWASLNYQIINIKLLAALNYHRHLQLSMEHFF